MATGLYISVPFCRTKCTYCNFASDVFSKTIFERYVKRLCDDLAGSQTMAKSFGAGLDRTVDSIYFGGGTPTILDLNQLERIFVAISQNFDILPDAEITIECAPGTLTAPAIDLFNRCRVNRVSLGVQSFVDQEARAVGRLHNRLTVFEDIKNLHAAGMTNLNIDLIAGLPHQTAASWQRSLDEALATAAPHVSVYMLEIDDDSRLGRELIAGGTRYHAHLVPDEDLTADLYESACARLQGAGIKQYEISNFARPGFESRHNLKYWTRRPYLGFGVDAHSMLLTAHEAVRFATPDSFEAYLAGNHPEPVRLDRRAALEEAFFLGLRLNCGVDTALVPKSHEFEDTIRDLVCDLMLEREGSVIRLTPRGRIVSNEVFQRFLLAPAAGKRD